uniref:hypothetical protein n=1 Tax=Pseudomonas moorei TaxID=395599 RepID=UPI00200EAC19
ENRGLEPAGLLRSSQGQYAANGVLKIRAEEIIFPISHRIAGMSVTNFITEIVMGNPLSFESTDLLDLRANLTSTILAGVFTTEIVATCVLGHFHKWSTVVPGCDYALTMAFDRQGSTGEISGTGEVYLDLGTNFAFKVKFVGAEVLRSPYFP